MDSLHFFGYINDKGNNKLIKNVKVELFEHDTLLIRTIYTNDSGYYQFSIPLYSEGTYKVKVSYPNYIHKYFEIDTKGIPKNAGKFPVMQASLTLWKIEPLVNYDFFEIPLNRFSYNPYKDNMEYDHSYLEASLRAMKLITQVEEKVRKQNELLVEKKEKESLLLFEQKQKKYLLVIITFVILLTILSFFAYLRQNKMRKLLNQQKNEVEKQKQIVDEKQKEIIESISYAKRLQDAILPPKEFVNTQLKNNFIYYQPKDIVAGDFYWAEKVNDLFYIAAADSTGHGVPGAIMSLVCSNALNRTIKEFELTETGKILDKTRELVIETFEKNSDNVKDGMDISLLCIDSKSRTIFWSGANNPLWYIQGNELKEIKADKQPIGKTDQPKPFTTHKIEYKENTTFYLFTDGLADQFGGPNGKKFKYKQFSDLLLKNNSLTMEAQAKIVYEAFSDWKGDKEQVDDVCVIGIKI